MLPLQNLTVIDFSQGPAGGLASMILSDYGASVIKVDGPEGDWFEANPAAPMWLRGKRRLSVNLDDPVARADLDPQLGNADVVITSGPVGELETRQLDYRTLSSLSDRIVCCHITAMGEDEPIGPQQPAEAIVAAKTGRMLSMQGISREPGPSYSVVQVATHATAMNTVTGIIAALWERERSGKGQKVHTSLLQGLMPYDMAGSLTAQMRARRGKPAPQPSLEQMPPLNYHPAQCKNGEWIQLGNLLAHLYRNYLNATGLSHLTDAPPYDKPEHEWSTEERESFRDLMLARMQEKTVDEWMEIFVADGGVVAHRYQSTVDALDDPDIVANGHVTEVDGMRQIGPLANMTLTPAQPGIIKSSAVPFVPAAASAPSRFAENSGPLAGLVVLELATIIAAPLGASFLADLGARVIKVEPVGGDPFRSMGMGAWRCNQGKEALGVDLKSAAGQKIVKQLADDADIVIHNYRPGVPTRLGIDYATLSADNPGLVYISANGYGPHGPGAKRPSTHPIPGAALGGAKHQAGNISQTPLDIAGIREAARRLMRANEVNPDPNTSMVVSATAMLGLMARDQTGIGQPIFIDMFGANAYANFDDFLAYPSKPPRAALDPALRGTGSTHRLYPCAEGWVFLGIHQSEQWQQFCELTGATGLADAGPAATEHLEPLTTGLTIVFARQTSTEWEALLCPHGIPCVTADERTSWAYFHQLALDDSPLMHKVEQLDLGEYYRHGSMLDFSRSEPTLAPPTRGGEHSRAIVYSLGYSGTDIDAMFANNVLWSAPPPA